jgi:hypothetical protein
VVIKSLFEEQISMDASRMIGGLRCTCRRIRFSPIQQP